MDRFNDGGPAFPCDPFIASKPGNEAVAKRLAEGMSLRDYFATKAMQGYLANPWQAKELDSMGESSGEQMAIVADISYAMADAMLKVRIKSND